VDLVKIEKAGISSDEYIFLFLRLLGKEPPKIISENVKPEKLQKQGYIKIVDGGFVKRPKLEKLFAALLATTNVEDWIDEYRHIWPSNIKSGGKPVRGGKADCVKKMKAFLVRTGYTKEQILSAALAYVLERKGHDYQYMTLANYFIQKDKDSPLEAWCELMEEDEERVKSFGTFHKEV